MDRSYGLSGRYRRVLCHPEDVEWSAVLFQSVLALNEFSLTLSLSLNIFPCGPACLLWQVLGPVFQ